jgi:preprotein translocase subunit SecA
MDHLKEGINLRGYAGRDPKIEYQREAFALFEQLGQRIRSRAVQQLFRVQLPSPEEMESVRERERARREQLERRMQEQHAGAETAAGATGSMARAAQAPEPQRTVVREAPKVGRNDPCPCGSGQKYKKCHGANAA